MLLTVTLLSVATLVLWGVSDFLAGRSGRHMDHYVANFLLQIASLVLLVPFVVYHGLSISSFGDFLVMVAVGSLFTLAYVYFIRALAKGPVGVAAPIANSYAVVTLILSLLFFTLALSGQMLLALFLVIAGVVLLSSDRTLFRGKLLHRKTVYLALVPFIAWGVGFTLLNLVVSNNEWYEMLFVITGSMVVLGAITVALWTPQKSRKFGQVFARDNKMPLIAGLIGGAGAIAFFTAGGIAGSFIIPAVVASASPLVTSYAAYLVDREKLSYMNRACAVLVVIGIALLNL